MWPKRRVQIVLKLVKSPREVLLNFDLDVCATGWDGTEVWMLPRFVRALETGTNVFTMDLINGHYLGDRKATRDKRTQNAAMVSVFPNLHRLALPFQSLTPTSKTLLASISLGEKLRPPPLSLLTIARESREWTRQVVQRYIKNSQSNSAVTDQFPESGVKKRMDIPITSEPQGRSCLTGFELFMRHVALWEMEQAGEIDIRGHVFAEDVYNNIGQVAYDDTPSKYEWDENFNIKDFIESIDRYNDCELQSPELEWRNHRLKFPTVQRVTHASSITEILFQMKGILGNEKIIPLTVLDHDGKHEVLTVWRLNKVLNWQMVDRRIDEVREVLWAFHRANERLLVPELAERIDFLRTNLSKRAIRISEKDENLAFVRWVGREPYDVDGLSRDEDTDYEDK
ncbi:hypothetical protein BDP27DRAFT_1355325 [Rhodocollybia butyracea]|uniref:Uncharacterized protein n=1 Tax=Rhodocollybia butyracea TaxID=206335 RepID=A0A9P5P0R4_9AGAR|nr:hypothetical protein BDP27DRAFT_1355325 [Rhodocollybia butyracea]